MDVASEIVNKLSKQQSSKNIPDSVRENMEKILAEAREQTTDIVGALVTSSDGLPWAKLLPENFDTKRFSAMSSALLALSTTLAKEADRGKTLNVMVEGDNGNSYIISAGPSLLLTVFTKKTSNLGLTLAHTRVAAENIAKVKQQHDSMH